MNKAKFLLLFLFMQVNHLNSQLAIGSIEEFFIEHNAYDRRIQIYYPFNNQIDQDTKYSEIRSMLPISGIDGTLKNIYRSNLLLGQMKLKTGTLNGVRCLAGFVSSVSGKNYRFVFMHNNFDDHDYELQSFTKELLSMIVMEKLSS